MNHDPNDAAAQAERGRLRATLADLKRLKQRRRSPPAATPPARESPFKFVPASFIADIDWDAADRAPGPEQHAANPAPPEREYDGVLEKMDFFLTEFDWQDEPDGTATAADAGGDRHAAGDSLGWEEASASASASAPPPPAEPPEEAAPPPTTDGIFTSFQWE